MFEGKESAFYLDSLGGRVRVSYPDFLVEGAVNEWHELVILHYLEMADGTPLSGELITFGQLPQGMVRGGGMDRESEKILGDSFGDSRAERMTEVCKSLGARILESKADLTAVFDFLPRYPITMNLWFSDDEFTGTGKLLLDRSAEHYLSVEDAVTAAAILLDILKERFKESESIIL
ncbi:MAG: DUF3786 domain-containing protein [Lachnospiraceae bacterium]|nr:DUF3786 domain-containing protein [Lachnospiraceae bacterium]